jgi:hypothetical protein
MEVFLRSAFYFLFLVYPVTMGLMLRHKKTTIKQLILITNTLLSVFFGILGLYLATLDQASPSLSQISSYDWMLSITVSVFLWLFVHLFTKPFHRK